VIFEAQIILGLLALGRYWQILKKENLVFSLEE
jgi:hypothetical protein